MNYENVVSFIIFTDTEQKQKCCYSQSRHLQNVI